MPVPAIGVGSPNGSGVPFRDWGSIGRRAPWHGYRARVRRATGVVPSTNGRTLPTRRRAVLRTTQVGVLFGIANLLGAVVVFVFLTYVLAPLEGGPAPGGGGDQVVVFVAYMVAAVTVGAVPVGRVLNRTARWLRESAPPSAEDRDLALRLPALLGAVGLAGWLGAAVLFGVINAAQGEVVLEVLRVVVGIVLGGISTSALSFLLLERALRPVFARALEAGIPSHTKTVGIRPKLVLSWALGSGIPLLAIAAAPVGRRSSATVGDLAALAAIGLVSGGLMVGVAARGVGDRLVGVRRALRQVQEGDTDVVITVDEGGDLGLLQAGFNEMVAGVRERERLRDLFGRHVGDEVARQAIEREGGLSGEQREVSAMFVDLIGSTALAAALPATEVVAVLNHLFGAVVTAAAAEGGWVNKFEGDGALCIFGAPEAQPDHARRALRAARALREELRRLQPSVPALDVGVGVSSGSAVAGNVGSERRYEYTVVGDPVNEAARLTELAKVDPCRLLASRSAILAAGEDEALHWCLVGHVQLRGRSAPSEVYQPAAGRISSAVGAEGLEPPTASL